MKIGLYFGSFNPVHVGHLIIANYMAYQTELEQVWFIVSPQNPLKKSRSLLNEYDRLYLTELAVGDEPRLKVSNVEFSLPRPSYTIDTMTYLSEEYPEHQFAVIMGSDSLLNLPRWKNYETLKQTYPIYVYLRPGFEPQPSEGKKVTLCQAPLIDISSSQIRKLIRSEKSVRYLVPERAHEYLVENKYYQS